MYLRGFDVDDPLSMMAFYTSGATSDSPAQQAATAATVAAEQAATPKLDQSIPSVGSPMGTSNGPSTTSDSFVVGNMMVPNSSAQFFRYNNEDAAKLLLSTYGGKLVRAAPLYSYSYDAQIAPTQGQQSESYYWSPMTGDQNRDFLFVQKYAGGYKQANATMDAMFTILSLIAVAITAGAASGAIGAGAGAEAGAVDVGTGALDLSEVDAAGGLTTEFGTSSIYDAAIAMPGAGSVLPAATSSVNQTIGSVATNATPIDSSALDLSEYDTAGGLNPAYGSSSAYDAATALPGAGSSLQNAVSSVNSTIGTVKSAIGIASAVGLVGGAKSATGTQNAAAPQAGMTYNSFSGGITTNTLLIAAGIAALLMMNRK